MLLIGREDLGPDEQHGDHGGDHEGLDRGVEDHRCFTGSDAVGAPERSGCAHHRPADDRHPRTASESEGVADLGDVQEHRGGHPDPSRERRGESADRDERDKQAEDAELATDRH